MSIELNRNQRAKLTLAANTALNINEDDTDSPLANFVSAIAWNDLSDAGEILSLAAAIENAVDAFMTDNSYQNCALDVSQLILHQPNLVAALKIAGLVQDGASRQWTTGTNRQSLPVLVLPENILREWIAT